MRILKYLIQAAKRLSLQEWRHASRQLERLDLPRERQELSEEGELLWQEAGRYRCTLAVAGTMHADLVDVSSDKTKVLAELYADEHVAR